MFLIKPNEASNTSERHFVKRNFEHELPSEYTLRITIMRFGDSYIAMRDRPEIDFFIEMREKIFSVSVLVEDGLYPKCEKELKKEVFAEARLRGINPRFIKNL